MELLAKITKLSIDKKYISYDDLYWYNEEEIFFLWKGKQDKEFLELIDKFENIKKSDIVMLDIPNIKIRNLNPIINGKRSKQNENLFD